MIDFENIQIKFSKIISTEQWKQLALAFKSNDDIYIVCHGGNLAIARHLATDLSRLSGYTKKVMAPDVDTVAIWHGDFNYENWLVQWLELNIKKREYNNALVLGISSSGKSPDVDKAILWTKNKNIKSFLISGKAVDLPIVNINLDVKHYYMGEALTLFLAYELLAYAGFDPPKLKTISKTNSNLRENSFPDELKNLAIDFDGPIHKCSKGYYDGTIYDSPVNGAKKSLKLLSKKYDIIIFTAKAKPDRGLVNNKTGTELVWEWLKMHKMDTYVKDVTSEKPRAVAYIDDKGITFSDNWENILEDLL